MLNFTPERTPNDHKFRELILFICQRSEGDKPFGAIKLNKLLFYSDFRAYVELGAAITWHRYQKLENGPAPIAMLPIAKKMTEDHEIEYALRNYYGKEQKRTIALRPAKLSVFSAEEIALVTEIIEEHWGRSASQMTRLSHDFVGWRAARMKEEIPYETALVNLRDPTEAELERGLELEDRAKECLATHVP